MIPQSALELVRERGIESATVEAICEAAGISQRASFNYFAFKEAVFIVSPEPLPLAAVKRFVFGRGDLMQELNDLMVAHAVVKCSARIAKACCCARACRRVQSPSSIRV